MRLLLSDRAPDQEEEADVPVDKALRHLSKRKSNYSGRDDRELRYANGVLVPSAVELPNQAGGVALSARKHKAEAAVLEGLKKLSELDVAASDASGPSFLPNQLYKFGLAQGVSKKDLGDAMRRLMVEGRIRKAVLGKRSNGSQRTGLVVVG